MMLIPFENYKTSKGMFTASFSKLMALCTKRQTSKEYTEKKILFEHLEMI